MLSPSTCKLTIIIYCTIYYVDNSFLDWFNKSTDSAHPVFGKIIDNYSLVQQISRAASRNDNPITPIKMISVRVE
jgi:cyclophilin family peptidyl-prolyl cis-trans isomerase